MIATFLFFCALGAFPVGIFGQSAERVQVEVYTLEFGGTDHVGTGISYNTGFVGVSSHVFGTRLQAENFLFNYQYVTWTSYNPNGGPCVRGGRIVPCYMEF